MQQHLESTRIAFDLQEERDRRAHLLERSFEPPTTEVGECTCPDDCPHDHENE